MKKHFLLLLIAILAFCFSFSQSVGINNNGAAPNPSSMLDINSPVKGLLIPRVALTGTDDINTISTPATSLLIYNTSLTNGDNGVTPGYYYWSGSAWIILSTGSSVIKKDNVDSLANTGYATIYRLNKARDSVQENLSLKKDNSDSIDAITGYTTLYQNSLKEVPLDFTTGLTRTGNTVMNNLSVGVAGGQKIVGSTSTNSGITYIATSGASAGVTGADHVFKVGNNGSVEAMRIVSDSLGYVGIGTSSPTTVLHIKKNLPPPGHNTVLKIENGYGAGNFGLNTAGGYWQPIQPGGFFMNSYNGTGTFGIANGGNVGVGTQSPTAFLQIKAGTTSTAPFKLTSGSLLTTAQAGAIEFNNDSYYATITTGAARKTFAFLQSPTFTGTVSGITQSMVGLSNVDNTSDVNKPISTATQTSLVSKWSNLGNAGTNASTNFIGTTDNVPFNIKVNNQKAGSIDNTLSNAFFGYQSANANTTGNNNTAIGTSALTSNVTGNSNTALGSGADVSINGLSNTTAIGSGAIVTVSNAIQLGNTAVTDVYFGNGGTTLHANSIITPSDKRFKYNIQNNVPGLEFIKKLTPVTYYFDDEKLNEYTRTGVVQANVIRPVKYKETMRLHTGFLAQDVEKAAKELGYDFDGLYIPARNNDHYSLAYTQFIMPLVKAVQEQEEIIEDQNKKIDRQSLRIKQLDDKVEALVKAIQQSGKD